MKQNFSEQITAIHDTVSRGFFVVAGGGSRVLSRLLSVPGASRTVLEARVPYSCAAMADFLGSVPEQFCSEPTARRIAAMAWQKAQKYERHPIPDPNSPQDHIFGFALTAALASTTPHRGEHRAYAAFHSASRTVSYALELEKGVLDRDGEEELTAAWALDLIAEFCGTQPAVHTPANECQAETAWSRVLTGKLPYIEIFRDGTIRETLSPETIGIFPGSYAPIHAGHCEIHRLAEQRLGGRTALELAILNADKPPLDFVTIRGRLTRIFEMPEFTGQSVLLSGLPFFTQKAEHFPNRTFAVGMDTLERINSVKYHSGEPLLLEKSHMLLKERGARFLVFGRVRKNDEGTQSFETFIPERFPETLRSICSGISESEFRSDLSSTQIRARKN